MSTFPNRSTKRTADEGGLHTWFETIIDAQDADKAAHVESHAAGTAASGFAIYQRTQADAALESALAWAKSTPGPKGGENSKYHKILACPFARLYFTTLCRLSVHFRGSKDVTVKTFLARQGRDMGVRDCYFPHWVVSNPCYPARRDHHGRDPTLRSGTIGRQGAQRDRRRI